MTRDMLTRAMLEDPAGVLADLDRIEAEESLLGYVRQVWHVLHPRRELKIGWALEAIAEHLEAVFRGEITRLLINCPPGMSKSLLTNVFLPTWAWGPMRRPDLQFIAASYSEGLSIRDNRRCRRIIESPLYQALYGDVFHFVSDQNTKRKFETNEGGWKFATSVGGTGTGERADIFLIDDPLSVQQAESEALRREANLWFAETVQTRVNDEGAAIVVIMQRLHELDTSGLILSKGLGYDHLCLPMEYEPDHPFPSRTTLGFVDPRTEPGELLFPERFSANYLEQTLKPSMRSVGGTYAEVGQLQQRPAPRGGGIFKRANFQTYDQTPGGVRWCRGWDLAASETRSSSWTVGAKVGIDGSGRVYVADVDRLRGGPHEVERRIVANAKRDGVGCVISIPQDPGQAGKSQRSYLAALLHGYDVRFSPETGSKTTRAMPFAAQVEARNVFVPAGAPWVDDYLIELASFDSGEFDDQVDATSRAYAQLVMAGGKRRRRPVAAMFFGEES